MRTRIATLLALGLSAPLMAAEPDPRPHYISDDVTISLRDQPGTDAPTQGTVHSGDRVVVLQSQGTGSFARIRTADGREGWLPERYLTEAPAARDRLDAMQKQLDEAQSQVQSLKSALDGARQQLTQVKPTMELAAQNDQLRARVKDAERQLQSLRASEDEEAGRRQTLLAGGGLIGAGLVLGLILPWLMRPRRRRYSDF